MNWPRIEEVAGATTREIGLLVFVFAPLDAAFSGQPGALDRIAPTLVGALLLIVVGILLEAGD